MGQEDGKVHVPQHVAGDATEDHLAKTLMAVAAHHQQLGGVPFGCGQQRLANAIFPRRFQAQ